jgi:UDP-GlcNAc:undecaprenyl-phosphate GlcNAc-1-phosphate transferase
MTWFYISVFVGSVTLSVLLTRFIRDFAARRAWIDRPNTGRHLHTRPVPRLGGVALFLSYTCATATALIVLKLAGLPPMLSIRPVIAIAVPALLMFLMGLYDDQFSLGPYWKFAGEAAAAVLLYFGGLGIHAFAFLSSHRATQAWIGLPLTILWVLLISNAFNLIDGLDGLAAGSALFATLIMFVVSLLRHTPLVSLLTIALAGSILGFLRYNFHPASIFLGDSGSLFIGFLLSALALTGSQKATTIVAVTIPVVAFGLPLLDVILSVIRRFVSGRPLFRGDNDHIHHKLIKRGLSHRNAVLVLYAVTATFGFLSLILMHGEVMIGFVLAFIGLGVWWGVQELRYLEFFELAATARRLRYRKRTIANNLRVRRAIESFDNARDFQEICMILRIALEPIGFDGLAILCPQIDRVDESFLTPLHRNGDGRYCDAWRGDPSVSEWELKLDLVLPAESKLGEFYLFRTRTSEPLLLDMNLLSNGFRDAISATLFRAIHQLPRNSETPGRSELALSASASRQSSHSK